MKDIISGLILSTIVCGTLFVPGEIRANTRTQENAQSIIEKLIQLDIIPSENIAKAEEILTLLAKIKQGGAKDTKSPETITVRASQLIEFANLEFTEGANVEGLLLLVTNESSENSTLTARRGCQVSYTISTPNDVELFDSAMTESCQTGKLVAYVIPGLTTRMFQVTHMSDDQQLTPGTYTFELEYPGYGSDSRTVTILQSLL